jgi:hypothetical protein
LQAGARLARFYSFPVVLLKLDVPKAATTCSTGYSVSKTPIQASIAKHSVTGACHLVASKGR